MDLKLRWQSLLNLGFRGSGVIARVKLATKSRYANSEAIYIFRPVPLFARRVTVFLPGIARIRQRYNSA